MDNSSCPLNQQPSAANEGVQRLQLQQMGLENESSASSRIESAKFGFDGVAIKQEIDQNRRQDRIAELESQVRQLERWLQPLRNKVAKIEPALRSEQEHTGHLNNMLSSYKAGYETLEKELSSAKMDLETERESMSKQLLSAQMSFEVEKEYMGRKTLLSVEMALEAEKKDANMQAGMVKSFRAAYEQSAQNCTTAKAQANKASKNAQQTIAKTKQLLDKKSAEARDWKTRCQRAVIDLAVQNGQDPEKALAALPGAASTLMKKNNNKPAATPSFKRKWGELSSTNDAIGAAPAKKGKLPQLASRRGYAGGRSYADEDEDDEEDNPLAQLKREKRF